MKQILSRFTPRGMFITVAVTELLLGVTYVGVILSQYTGVVLPTILQYIYLLIDVVCMTIGILLAVRQADGKRYYSGMPLLGIFIATLLIKDYIANFYSLGVEGGYLVGDALLISLYTTFMSTPLLTSLYLFITYSLAYLFFSYRRNRDNTVPADIWSLAASPMLAAACFISCMIFAPDFLITLVSQIIFLVRDVLWLPSVEEVVYMALDLILIPLFGFLAYVSAYAVLKYVKEKEIPEGSVE